MDDYQPPIFCKYHNTSAKCKLEKAYYDDGTTFEYCKRDPCMIFNEGVYDKIGGN